MKKKGGTTSKERRIERRRERNIRGKIKIRERGDETETRRRME
jgi:hypothetical protein